MRPSVCLVEDSADNRLLIHAVLDGRYDVSEFTDGASALAGLRTVHPDVVLLDISLPDMDGTEVLARIRRDPHTHSLRVIALTGHAKPGDRARFLAAGFDEYVSKPIVDDELLHGAIAYCLSPTEPREGVV
jgi:two-component system cell cycle response regulator DivK